eukprot:5444118-Ditylum_brightwellii.AAC.1
MYYPSKTFNFIQTIVLGLFQQHQRVHLSLKGGVTYWFLYAMYRYPMPISSLHQGDTLALHRIKSTSAGTHGLSLEPLLQLYMPGIAHLSATRRAHNPRSFLSVLSHVSTTGHPARN